MPLWLFGNFFLRLWNVPCQVKVPINLQFRAGLLQLRCLETVRSFQVLLFRFLRQDWSSVQSSTAEARGPALCAVSCWPGPAPRPEGRAGMCVTASAFRWFFLWPWYFPPTQSSPENWGLEGVLCRSLEFSSLLFLFRSSFLWSLVALVSLHLQLHPFNSWSPRSSTRSSPSLFCSLETLSAVGTTSLVSCLSGVTLLCCSCPVTWKPLFHVFYPVFDC